MCLCKRLDKYHVCWRHTINVLGYIALLTAERTYAGYYILNPVTLDLITHMNEM